MNNESTAPRLKHVEIVDCQNLTHEEIVAKIQEISDMQDNNAEDDVLTLMLTLMLTEAAVATLEDLEDGKQKLTIEIKDISDEDLIQLQENLLGITQYYTDLGIVLIRNRTATLEEASIILNQGG